MSQVIITDDRLNERRQKSAEQEHKIQREVMLTNRMSDTSAPDPVAKVLGVAAIPILALWGFICILIFLATIVLRGILVLFGKVAGGKLGWNLPYADAKSKRKK